MKSGCFFLSCCLAYAVSAAYAQTDVGVGTIPQDVRTQPETRVQTESRQQQVDSHAQGDAHAQAERKRVCFSAAESREKVSSHRLIEPFKALKTARSQARADPLSSRLCRWNEEYVYEITLLKRSGKIVHIFMNAADGKLMNPKG